jgi:ABC-2 type transport system permease protein
MTTRTATTSRFAGTWMLVRFNLRRDRVKFPAWVLGITLMVVYFTNALPLLYGSEEEMAETASAFLTGPVVSLFGGPGYGLDELTYPRFFVGIYGLYVLLMAALMTILMVSRHTRVEEQMGRAELVRANVVGRRAPLTAALVVTAGADVVLGILIAVVMVGKGYAAAGSLLFGAAVAAVGLTFIGIAAITAQVSEFSKTAAGLSGIAIGAAYAIRTAGDAIREHGSLLSWFSPLAWSQQTRSFVDERWWPLLISVVFAVVAVGVGYALAERRDLGAGLFRVRSGPARAAGWLDSPLAVAYRLQRGSIIGWTAALVVWGFGNGIIVEPIVDGLRKLSTDVLAIFSGDGAASLIDGYLAAMGLYNAALVAVFVVLGVVGLRSEEYRGRAEPVLSTATSRWDWLGSHLTVLALGSSFLLAVTGLAMGIGAAIGMGQAEMVWEVTAGHLVFIPAILVILTIAGLLYGLAPRALGATWIVVAYGFFMGFWAKLWDLPQWVHDLSPMEHIPGIPGEALVLTPLLVLMALAAALAWAAARAFRSRDLIGT